MRELGIFKPRQLFCSQFNDDNSDYESGGGSSSLVDHIFDQAATLTNTLLLRNANPVNTAILTNTPISTPQISTGITATSSNIFTTFAILALGGLAVFAGLRYAER